MLHLIRALSPVLVDTATKLNLTKKVKNNRNVSICHTKNQPSVCPLSVQIALILQEKMSVEFLAEIKNCNQNQ